jgi:hypothetical protein
MSFKQLSEDFPIFLWENFEVIDETRKKELMNTVLENKKRNHFGSGGSFKVDQDNNSFFKNLYSKFFKNTFEFFGNLNILPNNSSMCWSYSSNNIDHGPGLIHNHVNTSSINSVYYLNVPNSATIENGSIQFFLENKTISYRPNNFDLIIFPNYLDHKINYLNDSEYRISINMEILCENNPQELFTQKMIRVDTTI